MSKKFSAGAVKTGLYVSREKVWAKTLKFFSNCKRKILSCYIENWILRVQKNKENFEATFLWSLSEKMLAGFIKTNVNLSV